VVWLAVEVSDRKAGMVRASGMSSARQQSIARGKWREPSAQVSAARSYMLPGACKRKKRATRLRSHASHGASLRKMIQKRWRRRRADASAVPRRASDHIAAASSCRCQQSRTPARGVRSAREIYAEYSALVKSDGEIRTYATAAPSTRRLRPRRSPSSTVYVRKCGVREATVRIERLRRGLRVRLQFSGTSQ